MAKVLCATPRSGSTAIGEWLKLTYHVEYYAEFCNPRYMEGLYGQSWKVERDRCMNKPRVGLKIMREHVTEHITPYIQKNGADLIIRADKISQAVSYYVATSTGRWYKTDGKCARPPKFDYDKIAMHLNRIIMQEEAWINYFMQYDIDFETTVYEEAIKKGFIDNNERDKVWFNEKVDMVYQFHNALWNRTSMEWANTFRGKWKGEKV